MAHACHANGCESPDVHPEIPFCKKHWEMLPEPHQKKLWRGRTKGECAVCEDFEEATAEWRMFAHLGIALLCYLEYGDHDCPEELTDADGFCWGCGVQDAAKLYRQAASLAKKYGLKTRG